MSAHESAAGRHRQKQLAAIADGTGLRQPTYAHPDCTCCVCGDATGDAHVDDYGSHAEERAARPACVVHSDGEHTATVWVTL